MWNEKYILFWMLTMGLVVGCGGEDMPAQTGAVETSEKKICRPDAVEDCNCATGEQGTKICATDGLIWGFCSCDSKTDSDEDFVTATDVPPESKVDSESNGESLGGSDSEGNAETETETETETKSETELDAGLVADKDSDTGVDSSLDGDTGTGTDTKGEVDTGVDTGSKKDTDTGADTGSKKDTDSGTKGDTATDTDTYELPEDELPRPNAVPSAGCGTANWPASGTYSIDVDGTERTYIVSIPDSYEPNTPYRLIFTWHGLNGTAQQIADTNFYRLKEGFPETAIFVSGQGLSVVGGETGWSNRGGRDSDFTRALVDFMRSKYCIDETRIFSTGMSYGGIMSNTVGCLLGDVFRAIAPMSGGGPSALVARECKGQVAVWMSHGINDTQIPTVTFDDGQDSRDHWKSANHCSDETEPVWPGPCVAYKGCDEGYPLHWCAFDGAHVVPGFAPWGIWYFFYLL